jgi:hypothetical protein
MVRFRHCKNLKIAMAKVVVEFGFGRILKRLGLEFSTQPPENTLMKISWAGLCECRIAYDRAHF